MRHNLGPGAIIIMLRSLGMHGMAQAVDELTEQGSPGLRGGAADPDAAPEGLRRPTGRSDRRPASSRPRASRTIVTSPASTSRGERGQ
jgi:hypothetical protein